MRGIRRLFVIATALLAFAAGATAAPSMRYTISGTGSGSIGGTTFADEEFTLTMIGDMANFSGNASVNVVSPLNTTTLTVAGIGTTTLTIGTRLGFNAAGLGGNAVFLGRTSGGDLFDFNLTSPVLLNTVFGPVTGSNVFALNQFQDVTSTLGLIDFNESSSVLFQSFSVPTPATVALLGIGLAGLGVARRRKTK